MGKEALSIGAAGLRAFLRMASENEKDCLLEHEGFVDFIDKVDGLFRKIVSSNFRGGPVVGMLLLNAHASYLAAVRIAFSAQSPPTHMALRGALESALYGLIASHSRENGDVWLNRDKDPGRCRRLYTARNGINLVQGDPALCELLKEAYELAIEFGAHPNQRSVVDHIQIGEENDKSQALTLTYLHHARSTETIRAILACIEVGLTIILMMPHIFSRNDTALAAHAEACNIRVELIQFLEAKGYHTQKDQTSSE